MKNNGFWIRRYLSVSAIAFIILMAAALLRGRAMETALSESFLWALISAAVFTGWRYYQARKGVACAMCNDTVDGPG